MNNMDYKELLQGQDFSAPTKFAEWVWKLCSAIENLSTENQALRNAANGFKKQLEAAETRAEKAERERDAAVNDLRIFGHCCSCCKWFNAPNCKAKEPCGTNDNWEWRGLKED